MSERNPDDEIAQPERPVLYGVEIIDPDTVENPFADIEDTPESRNADL